MFIKNWNNLLLYTSFIAFLGALDTIVVLDLNPVNLLQIKATSTQVGIIRMSKVDKGLSTKRSELTTSYDVLGTQKPHSTFNNILCHLKTAPLAQLIAIFELKNIAIALESIYDSTTLGGNIQINTKESWLLI